MKKIVTILLFALTVFAGCSKDEKPTPAPTMPVNGVIYLHSESVLKNEPAAKADVVLIIFPLSVLNAHPRTDLLSIRCRCF